jgi:hypothetical protein
MINACPLQEKMIVYHSCHSQQTDWYNKSGHNKQRLTESQDAKPGDGTTTSQVATGDDSSTSVATGKYTAMVCVPTNHF